DWCGDRFSHRLGRSAGECGVDRDRRWRDLRVLGERQLRVGERADQRDEHGDDSRKDRPFDEEARNVHEIFRSAYAASGVVAIDGGGAAGEAPDGSTPFDGWIRPFLGVTFSPGRARWMPLMITRSCGRR